MRSIRARAALTTVALACAAASASCLGAVSGGGTGGAGGQASSSSSSSASLTSGTGSGTGGATAGSTTTSSSSGCTACYSGPLGTEGVGVCKGGCQSSGMCVGEVLPSTDDCTTAADESCDGAGCTGVTSWALAFGGVADLQALYAVAVDGDGRVAIAGMFTDQLGPLTSAGGSDIFVAMLTSSGSVAWMKRFGGTLEDVANGIAFDAAGDVYVVGSFQGSVDFGGLKSAGGRDAYIMKLASADGALLWARAYGDLAEQWMSGIALDHQGNLLVTGGFIGTINLGSATPLVATPGNNMPDIFVAKLDPSGEHLWSKRYGDDGSQGGFGIAVDAAGNVAFSGTMQGSADFGGGSRVSAGNGDIFVVELDAAGNYLWDKVFGDPAPQRGLAVAFDPSGNVIVAGEAMGTIDFGGGVLVSAGGTDVAVVKLSPTGAHLWSALYGDMQNQSAAAVVADAAGNITLVGGFYGNIDFGGGPLTSAGNADAFVVKLGKDRSHAWSKRFGDSTRQYANAVAVGAGGAVFVAGGFNGTLATGAQTLMSLGNDDMFLLRLAP